MQIIIVQSEIETAIRNHILDQIHVKDGMQIDIVLRATRGDEGTTAVIDIVPMKNTDASAAKQTSQPVALVKKESKAELVAPAASTASMVVKGDQTQKEVSQESGESTGGAVVGEAGTVQNASLGEAQVGGQPAQVEQIGGEVKAPARSLFAGMKKPVNG